MNFIWLMLIAAQIGLSFPGPRGTASGGGGTVAFVKAGEGFCSGCTSNSFSLPATTGSAHILYVGDTNAISSSANISSITGGGTWVAPSGCQFANAGNGEFGSCAYVLSSSSGTTSITINWGGAAGSHVWWYYEYSCSATASFDVAGNVSTTSNTSPTPGVGLTLSGANDLIFQSIKEGFSAPTGISSPYVEFNSDSGSAIAFATSENTTSGSAPSWTNGTAQQSAGGAVAIVCH